MKHPYRTLATETPRRPPWWRRLWWSWWGEPLAWTRHIDRSERAERDGIVYVVGRTEPPTIQRPCVVLWIYDIARQVGRLHWRRDGRFARFSTRYAKAEARELARVRRDAIRWEEHESP